MDNESVSSKAANLLRGMIQAGTWKTEQDIFRRGLCLPSDNKMTAEQQDAVIEIIRRCFR